MDPKRRAFVVAIIFSALIIIGISKTAVCQGASFNASINIVFDDGRVMFYLGSKNSMSEGDIYDIYDGNESVAKIELVKVDIKYSIGRIINAKRELSEGKQYSFVKTNNASETGETIQKSPAREEKKVEQKTETSTEEKMPDVKEKAKKSSRLKKVEDEEPAAEEKKKTESEPAEKKVAKQPVKVKEKKDKKAKLEEKPEYKPVPTKEERMKMFPGPTVSSGMSATGLSGMFIVTTPQTMKNNHALLSINYKNLSGSDTFVSDSYSYSIDADDKSTGYSFLYGVSNNAEVSIATRDSNTSMTLDSSTWISTKQKLSTMGIKYYFGSKFLENKTEPKKSNNTDVAVFAAYAKERVKDCDSNLDEGCTSFNNNHNRYLLYGLTLGGSPMDKVYLTGEYGRTRYKVTGYDSKTEDFWGVGLNYQTDERMKFFLEYMKETRYEKFKSLGVEYKYTEDFCFNAAYQIYTERISTSSDLDLKGYRIGANYLF